MYGALWRILPGPGWLRVLFLLVVLAAVVYVCFKYVYPMMAEWMPFNDGTVDEE